jgi:hypothetical protein
VAPGVTALTTVCFADAIGESSWFLIVMASGLVLRE